MQQLRLNEVQVWQIDYSPCEMEQVRNRLSLTAAERIRQQSFRDPDHGDRWAYFKHAKRVIIGNIFGLCPHSLDFSYSELGKPRLEKSGSHQLYFNLSHSSNTAILAATPVAEVGVDIEKIVPLSDLDDIARRFFSKDEQQRYFQSRLQNQPTLANFYRIWTQKEALIKAIGLGLTAPLEQFDVGICSNTDWYQPTFRGEMRRYQGLQVRALSCRAEFSASIALDLSAFVKPRIGLDDIELTQKEFTL